MENIRFEWIGIVFFFLILVSIQFSLNKIIVLLNELIRLVRQRKP